MLLVGRQISRCTTKASLQIFSILQKGLLADRQLRLVKGLDRSSLSALVSKTLFLSFFLCRTMSALLLLPGPVGPGVRFLCFPFASRGDL